MSQIEFKVEIATNLLLYQEQMQEDVQEISDLEEAKRPPGLPLVDVLEHVIWKIPDSKRKRCGYCHSQTIYQCKKCNIALHPKCFDEYHT